MKDGYYLATYLFIDKIGHLINVDHRHDCNIALFEKKENQIKLVHYWELERNTRLKHHSRAFYSKEHAIDMINSLLSTYNLSVEDMVEIWGTPQIQTCDDYHSINNHPDLVYHSMSHLYSGLFMDSDIFYNENIIALAVDGGPDGVLHSSENRNFYSGCVSKKGSPEFFKVDSPGPLWNIASQYYHLREGTLMALASASTSQAWLPDSEVLQINDSRTILDCLSYFEELVQKIEKLSDYDSGILFNGFDLRFTNEENKISMVMKEIQKMSIRIMEKNIDDIISKYDIRPDQTILSITGGYALNCPTNSYLMKKYNFKGFLAPPCVGDSGMSLGIGLYAFYKKLYPEKMNFQFSNAFYGDSDKSLKEKVHQMEFMHFVKSKDDKPSIDTIVSDIENYPIIWFNGRSEIGPRALGNRSIIGDPRKKATKDILNSIKKRQWWRPVAPIVLEEKLENWFNDSYPSPYMLHTFEIKKEKRTLIPAVSHIDYSARVQSINKNNNSELYKVLKHFYMKTGVPIICNTSLNDNEEPIINTIDEAVNFALRKGIRIIYINGTRLELHRHDEYKLNTPYPSQHKMEIFTNEERELLWKKENPHKIPTEKMVFYKESIEQNSFLQYDITNKREARKLLREVDLYLKYYRYTLNDKEIRYVPSK
ncbi:carbamoyltransferase C-terminal domain-containing protein [Cytobacillus praedii]|uniref:carbamoyltransferase C-terminal domain-containing protein n=1 Tax=Cytobacillus praedii TaxID=1742358 RepID=UPI003F7FDB06